MRCSLPFGPSTGAAEWAAQVKRHSVARLLARIPPIVNVPPISSTD